MKKIITIVIIVLAVLGLGWWLFKISPQQAATSSSGYNSALDVSSFKQISAVPAFDPTTDRYQGSTTAKNFFIEYGDYQCPACAAYSEMLKQVPTTFPNTVFVFRYFPLTQIHANSVEAAMAAEAAGAQGKYWEMHDILFSKQTDWESMSDPLPTFTQYAQQVGVADISKFTSDVTVKKYLPAIQKDSDEALGLNLQGTPTFIFNGHQLQNSDVKGMLAEVQQWVVK